MIFKHTQTAVDIVNDSKHPANKIAATLADANGQLIASDINHWPDSIANKIGTDTKIGNSSGTIHAETSCLIKAMQNRHAAFGASIFVTDPPCPNCAKNMAEAGILNLYIDHKGFDKDFAQRRSEDIRTLTLEVCKHAGINVFKIFRKEERTETLYEAPSDYKPLQLKPPHIETIDENPELKTLIENADQRHGAENYVLGLGINQKEETILISTEAHPSLGYETETMLKNQDKGNSKYATTLGPVNRLLMLAARHGAALKPDMLYSSRIPTSRELVNLVGAGFKELRIENLTTCRDEWGLKAADQLKKAGILTIRPFK